MDPPITGELVDEITDLWVRVTNAGGAVGYVPPATSAQIRPDTQRILDRIAGGTDTLITLADGDDRVVAWCVLEAGSSWLRQHWRTVIRVQVDPDLQGSGLGDRLMSTVTEVARERLGLAALCLSVRAGTGIERFYHRHGYQTVGRLPGAIRLGPAAERDEILMWLAL
ncbi:MAG: GNAT family N-acetyltransferase [Actinocatenispora sp.]